MENRTPFPSLNAGSSSPGFRSQPKGVGDRGARLSSIRSVSTPGTQPLNAGAHDLLPGNDPTVENVSLQHLEGFRVHEKAVDSSYSSTCGALAAVMVSPPVSGFVDDSRWWLF